MDWGFINSFQWSFRAKCIIYRILGLRDARNILFLSKGGQIVSNQGVQISLYVKTNKKIQVGGYILVNILHLKHGTHGKYIKHEIFEKCDLLQFTSSLDVVTAINESLLALYLGVINIRLYKNRPMLSSRLKNIRKYKYQQP